MTPKRSRNHGAVCLVILLVWQLGSALNFFQGADLARTCRRSALLGAISLAAPGAAMAKRGGGGGGEEGEMVTKQAMPSQIEVEEPISEEWQPVDVGESSLVDPDDPKYKQMRNQLLNDMEKQKQRNDEYNAMSAEERAQSSSFFFHIHKGIGMG